MRLKQAGFSLIELVIVVVILGLLAVTALPRFLDVTDEAQAANIEGMAGGFATGVSLVRAQWEAEGRPQVSDTNSVNYDGIRLFLTAGSATESPGYPLGLNATDSSSTAMTTTKCAAVWNSILQNPASLTDSVSLADDNRYFVTTITGPSGNTNCIYYLSQTLSRNGSGDLVAPTTDSRSVGNSFEYDPTNGRISVNIN